MSHFKPSSRLSVLSMHFREDRPLPWMKESLQWLRQHRMVLPLNEALTTLDAPARNRSDIVSIIVDDATSTFLRHGWQFFKELGIPITVAVVPGLVPANTREHLIARVMRVAGHRYWLPHDAMRRRAWGWMGKHAPQSATARDSFSALFEAVSGLSESALVDLIRYLRCDEASSHAFMTWDELKSLGDTGLVQFAAHSMSHPAMSIADGKWLEWELRRPIELIEEKLGVRPDVFVYPYGRPSDSSPAISAALKASGYRCAFLAAPGTVRVTTDRYRMPRCSGEDESLFRLHASPREVEHRYDDGGALWRRGQTWVAQCAHAAEKYSQERLRSIKTLVRYGGNRFYCPCCEGHLRTLKPFTGVFSIKGMPVDCFTPNAICPSCGSAIRNRFLVTVLREHTPLFSSAAPCRLLHFAPEMSVARQLRRRPNLDYVTGDIEPSLYFADTLYIDATDIPFEDESFDVVISSHVLDAIPDDQRAISEIHRILRPDGWTLVAVPIYGDTTYEIKGADEAQRRQMYGIDTHARLNGLDFREKLVASGFSVETLCIDNVPGNYVDRSVQSPHIESDKYLFMCRKISTGSGGHAVHQGEERCR